MNNIEKCTKMLLLMHKSIKKIHTIVEIDARDTEISPKNKACIDRMNEKRSEIKKFIENGITVEEIFTINDITNKINSNKKEKDFFKRSYICKTMKFLVEIGFLCKTKINKKNSSHTHYAINKAII